MSRFEYTNEKLKEISFPVGGIGTGCIGVAGNGLLADWEIFNRPNKRSYNGYTHFALKAEKDGEVLDARIILGDYMGSRMGSYLRNGKLHSGYGFGPERMTLAGMPHFQQVRFRGEYPLAQLQFSDGRMPAYVEMLAFNPFIPSFDADSSIPAAFFELCVRNTGDSRIDYSLAFSATNPVECVKSVNSYQESGTVKMLGMKPWGVQETDKNYGDLTIATDAPKTSCQQYWYRGNRSDSLEMFWKDFLKPGGLKDRYYPEDYELYKGQGRNKDTAVLAAHFSLEPGETGKVRFVLSWNIPYVYNYWNPEEDKRTYWKNYYTKLFRDSGAAAVYSIRNWDRLYGATRTFHDLLMQTTMPETAREAVLANIATLKTPTCLRLENGEFYGFEGCIEDEGCCEGSCSHVWNYAYALPFLFPKLERSMRDLDFRYNQDPSGKMSFRLQLPLGRRRDSFNACVDGQMGSIYKVYREWKISGDDNWLKEIYPAVKKAMEYAWHPDNKDRWDPDKSGVITGRQHHTLDMELFGANSWLTGFYLLALKSMWRMAEHLRYEEDAREYKRIFEKGKQWVDENLFNGSYFIQRIDLNDKQLLEPYSKDRALFGESVFEAYWNEESGQIKYQVGEGCLIDQVLAQWHADLSGLGEIFDRQKVKSALKAIHEHNYYKDISELTNTWRIYSLNEESGTVICTWPRGSKKPDIPVAYNSETMAGFEYQAGIHMIREGMEQEGLDLITAVRDRYDGSKRNPWNEIECGSNYARSMASYGLLLAYSGFRYDMSRGKIGFQPLKNQEDFFCFWAMDGGWGSMRMEKDRICLRVAYGEISLRELELPEWKADRDDQNMDRNTERNIEACIGKEILKPERIGDTILLHGGEAVRIKENTALEIRYIGAGSGQRKIQE